MFLGFALRSKEFCLLICVLCCQLLSAQLNLKENQEINDSIVFNNHKFYLLNDDGVAKLQVYPSDYKIPRKGIIKLAPPCKFARDFDGNILNQEMPFHEILSTLIIIGNPIRKCKDQTYSCYTNDPFNIREKDIKFLEDDFCGLNYQGAIVNYEGLIISEKVHHNTRRVLCSKGNFDFKNLYDIADEIVGIRHCR